MRRVDDFSDRRKHLCDMSDEQLKQRFWELAQKVTSPMVSMAKKHTSPSIERSVLMRMGFSSLEAKEIVSKCAEQGLLGKGAGHCVLKCAELGNCDYLSAGRQLAGGIGWNELCIFWKGGDK